MSIFDFLGEVLDAKGQGHNFKIDDRVEVVDIAVKNQAERDLVIGKQGTVIERYPYVGVRLDDPIVFADGTSINFAHFTPEELKAI